MALAPQPSSRTTDLEHREAESSRHHSPITVTRCVLCGDPGIDVDVHGRFVTTSCPACLAVFAIEFDPPDQPGLRARIERIDES
jgi:hypothetical protein